MITPEHFIAYLKGQTSITSEVGTMSARGHSGVPIVPDMEDWLAGQMPRRAIVVSGAGGPSILGKNNPLGQLVFDVRCYGNGQGHGDDWKLSQLVYDHFASVKRVRMGTGMESNGLPSSTRTR